jgi:hypothetical protein
MPLFQIVSGVNIFFGSKAGIGDQIFQIVFDVNNF